MRSPTSHLTTPGLSTVKETRQMEWFYETGGQQAGPLARSGLDALIASGTIAPQTLVWRAGQSEWLPYSAVAPAASAAEPPLIPEGAVAACVECGGTFARSEM